MSFRMDCSGTDLNVFIGELTDLGFVVGTTGGGSVCVMTLFVVGAGNVRVDVFSM